MLLFSFYMAECPYESHLSLSWYLSHYTTSISFLLFLFHPNSDGRTLTCVYSFQNHHLPQILIQTLPSFFFFTPYITVSYRTIFYFFSPPTSPQPYLFLISSISFVNGYSLFIFFISVFLDGILSLSVVFFTCLLVFPFLYFFYLFLLNPCFSSFGWLALEWENVEYVGRQTSRGEMEFNSKKGIYNMPLFFFLFFSFPLCLPHYHNRYHTCLLVILLCMRAWAVEGALYNSSFGSFPLFLHFLHGLKG